MADVSPFEIAWIAAGAALAGTLLTASATLVGAMRHEAAVDRRTQHHWQSDVLLRGMGNLTGGRQQRNIGIGIIEGLLSSNQLPPEFAMTVAHVTWNQLIFVVFEEENGLNIAHERHNALRLFRLVMSLIETFQLEPDEIDTEFNSRVSAIEQRIADTYPTLVEAEGRNTRGTETSI